MRAFIPEPTAAHTHIRIDGVSHAWSDRPVFSALDLVVDGSERVGLIGENGVGKSTLLGIIAGATPPDAGVVTRPARTGLLRQEVRHEPDDTVGDPIESSLGEVRAIERELVDAAAALATPNAADTAAADTAAADRYAAALAAAEAAQVWTIDARRGELLDGLGVGSIPLDRRLAAVSGGQRSRFALAALLLSRPTALVLDEPTNHLDDAAVSFLRRQLVEWPGPVIFASHDRAFLDEVATVLVDIDPSRASSPVTRFGGTYTDYLAAKAAERARWEAQFAAEEQELRDLEHAIAVTARQVAPDRPKRDNEKMGYDFKSGTVQAQVSRRVRNARGRFDELEENRVEKPTELLRFAGIPSGSHGLADTGPLLELVGAIVPHRLEVERLVIAPGSRLLVTGHNGAGKSTLLSVLAGEQRLARGTLRRRTGLRTAMLAQDVTWQHPERSARTVYESAVGESRARTVPLADLGLVGRPDIDRPVGALSLGQQRRLALAVIIARPPHVFLLDEPTNHLSLALATELEEALGGYPGAVVVASHDRWLRRRWNGPHRAMASGRLL